MECPKCGYEWIPRKPNPKACPMCKQYLARMKPKEVYFEEKEIPISDTESVTMVVQVAKPIEDDFEEPLKYVPIED